MLDNLRLIAAILLLFFIPGIMLVQALFPRKGELDSDFDSLYRLALGIGLSIVITILVNFGLNALGVNADTDRGYVTAVPITATLVLVSLIFFAVGWLRGGWPVLGRLHPSLIRFPAADPKDDDIPRITDRMMRFRHQELMKERFSVLKEITKTEKLADAHTGEQRKYYDERKKKLMTRLSEIEKDIEIIERGIPAATAEEKEDIAIFDDEDLEAETDE
ncbi:MAG: DUF1616 domain-containing protein [Candidatus Thermoplasmatota archaeon]|nr:DUF1616 domain-containing protein [Euryarchaeota archaeon]MBU4032771.1 DUF1616 domain-containing protein [Candidatus Thermoplasmatota archaeon]MBU4072217.1 DUF1616 domain-containing protein [Candidatus Thermoplasmatota archaeon]MBU4143970.1 DUF1616 domain-containing protein [Candidatus Thermoplasmatota archaeon]MBU4591916.1 DUF1616 domain-containing protein [Candidatus Thermoplasmatota archaeon]